MKFIKRFAAIVLVFSAVVVGGCNQNSADNKIRIGAVVFLTGPVSEIGQEVQRGMILAMKQVNAAGGINGKQVEIIFEDSKNTAKDAVNAYRKLLSEHVQVILLTGDIEFRAVNDLSKQYKMPTIGTVCSGGTNMPGRSPYLFRFLYSENTQSDAISRYAFQKLNVKKAAILYPNNGWGEEARELFKNNFTRTGGQVTDQIPFNMDDNDQRNIVTKVLAGRPAAICIKGWGAGFNSAVKQLSEAKYKGILLSDVVMGFNSTIQQTTPYDENAYFTSVDFDTNSADTTVKRFVSNYKTQFNRLPDFWGGFGYDCFNFTAEAIRAGKYESSEIETNILKIKELQGVMGLHKFDVKGDLQYEMSIKKIVNGKAVTIEKRY